MRVRSRDARRPGYAWTLSLPKDRGRRESRVSDAPAAPCAKVESTWVGTTGSPVQTGLPCAMVLTASFVLSPVTGLFCHRRLANSGKPGPVGPRLASARLDASVGASGPHDFAVRDNIVRLRAGEPLTSPIRTSPAISIFALTLPRPPHPAPRP